MKLVDDEISQEGKFICRHFMQGPKFITFVVFMLARRPIKRTQPEPKNIPSCAIPIIDTGQ